MSRRRRSVMLLGGCLLWLATGIFLVPINQSAVVLRFGRVVSEPSTDDVGETTPRIYRSGLHYDWPWPFSSVHRHSVQQTRTLTIGTAIEAEVSGPVLTETHRQSDLFLTGDKNLLEVQATIQFHLDESQLHRFVLAHAATPRTLIRVSESVLADQLAKSRVDFVYPQGFSLVSENLTRQLRRRVARLKLGVVIEQVTITHVAPPLPVRAYFVDVVNARAEQQREIQMARADGQRRLQEARLQAETKTQEALGQSTLRSTRAAARAHRFTEVLQQLHAAADFKTKEANSAYAMQRRLYMQRRYWETLQQILAALKEKVIIQDESATGVVLPVNR